MCLRGESVSGTTTAQWKWRYEFSRRGCRPEWSQGRPAEKKSSFLLDASLEGVSFAGQRWSGTFCTLISGARLPALTGLDISQHSERAYSLVESGGQVVSAEAEKRKALRIPLRGERFTAVVDGVEPEELISHWRHLCVDYGVGVSSELKELYGSFTTVHGNRFNFRGGDKEQIRSTLERLFRGVAKSAKVRIDS